MRIDQLASAPRIQRKDSRRNLPNLIEVLNNACCIPLNGGRVALVDPSDLARVQQHTWTAWRGRTTYYAKTTFGPASSRSTIYLHQFIMQPEHGEVVDHKNGNGLDCRRSNMRVCTVRQNGHNSSARRRSGRTSRFKGVSLTIRAKWMAQLSYGAKHFFLGTFDIEEEAALAYNHASTLLHGDFAKLNDVPDGHIVSDRRMKQNAEKMERHHAAREKEALAKLESARATKQ